MTRGEAETLLSALIPPDPPLPAQWVVDRETMMRLVSLASLGAKVIAPTEDEVKVVIDAWFSPALRTAPVPEEFIKRMRAALSALQEPQP